MRFFDLLGLLLIQVLWGFHWAILKFGLKEFPTLLLMGLRFAIVAALLCPFFRVYPVNQVMPFTLLVPVFGVVSGILMLDETLNVQMLLGSAATIAGVAIIVLRRPDRVAAGLSDG